MERMNEKQMKELVGKKFFVKCSDGAKFNNLILKEIGNQNAEVQFLYFENQQSKLNIIPIEKIERMEEI